MEVLVGFMEDQSERPVILGCLYSDANLPPWPAYIDHQKVGIRSQTRPADGGYSEMSIDDRQGGEVVQVRAQKDLREDVLNDKNASIGHDTTATVGHDSTTSIGHDEIVSVTNDRSVTVGANNTRSVTADETVNVKGSTFSDIRGNATLSVTGATQETLQGDVRRTIGGRVKASNQRDTQLSFADDYTERHLGHRTIVVGSDKARRTAVVHVEGRGRAYASQSLRAFRSSAETARSWSALKGSRCRARISPW
jgi:type VI secretion system secreted protein VgrG